MESTAARYPFELVDFWQTRDGERVVLRPVHPQDAELAREFVRALSPESRYNRFHQPLNDLTPQMARWATHVDYHRHLALIAVVVRDGREIEIGVARYVVGEGDDTAELAIAVADAWQGKGIGARLLGSLMQAAARRGLTWLEGEVLANNKGMLGLAQKLGFRVRSRKRGALTVTIERRMQEADKAPAAARPSRWLGIMQGLWLA
jgi:acetyltransferase